MAIFSYQENAIYYELHGKANQTCIVFINGLTQRTQHWKAYQEFFTKKGYQVLLFDLMGQGQSNKPALFMNFEDNPRMLSKLLTHLKTDKAFVVGISFGGVVALQFAIKYPQQILGLMPMSTFSEMDEQLQAIGQNLYEGMVSVGFEYLVKLFVPYNFSSTWIQNNKERVPLSVRESFSYNDLYAIQNMMESLDQFKGFTHDLIKIQCPTLIFNGEWDALTPRWCHEVLRKEIPNSTLILMPHVCHAFTLEMPQVTSLLIEDFILQVLNNQYKGEKKVYLANSEPKNPLYTLCQGDHTRAIPISLKGDKK